MISFIMACELLESGFTFLYVNKSNCLKKLGIEDESFKSMDQSELDKIEQLKYEIGRYED